MSLKSEIEALRAEIQALARPTPDGNGNEGEAPAAQEWGRGDDRHDVEAFLKSVNDTLDKFADDLDRFPRLTALAALGVGVAVGVVIGRQLR